MSDYIKLYRSTLEWQWYKNINTKVLFIHMLLKANWKDGKFEGKTIPRGSFVSSLAKLAEETDLTIREVRTAISHLEDTGEITVKRYSKYSVFTVKNYVEYQSCENQTEKKKKNDNTKENNEDLFEKLWKMYPNKKCKSQITEDDKLKLTEIGLEEMTRAIDRYKKYVEENKDWYNPKTGSSFFRGGYVDYLDSNYEESKIPAKKSGFNNFKQNEYDFEALEKELLSN